MTTPQLTDTEARRIIQEATGETIFVEAGAGTGKTTQLVGRILALVESGIPISQIAAITFTEKAAAELAERVRHRLEDVSRDGDNPERAERCSAALRDLDQAAIQTLHSFAMRILSLFPLEAGLPPRITLRDDVAASLVFDDRWRRFCDKLLDDPGLERALIRGLTLGLRLNDLKLIAEDFNDNWDRLANLALPAAPEPAMNLAAIIGPIEEVQHARRPGNSDSLTKKLDECEPFVNGLRGLVTDLANASAATRDAIELDALRLIGKMKELTNQLGEKLPSLGNKDFWTDIRAVRELIQEAEIARREVLIGTRRWVLCTLLPPLVAFVLEGAQERRREGALDYQDLLVFSRDLLQKDPAIRQRLHERFPRILIDEFQDTDPLQVELAALIAHEGPGEPAHWQSANVEPGRLFMVGDPKQSIYRFRRADIELFKRVRGAFTARHVPLSRNFRCRPGIIEWVNRVCERLFTGFGAGADARQADWIPLLAGRDAVEGPIVHAIGGPGAPGDPAPVLRRQEAEAVAAAVLAAQRDDWLKDTGLGRPTRYSDIAILLPTRTNSPAIEKALAEVDVPTRVESRSLLFAAQEVRDLTNILAAIDDPTDDVAVVAALRSPAFAVSDDDLLNHTLAGGRWDYTRAVPEASPEPMREAMAALAVFHEQRWVLSIGALVENVIATRRMLELGVTSRRPRETWRRLRFVSEQARSLGDSGVVTSLRQFVQWLRTQAQERALIAEAVANEPDDDAVRILTVHAAKGLEFPIVILAGLGVESKQGGSRVIWRHDNGTEQAAIRAGRSKAYFETPGYDGPENDEKQHQVLERHRLFYVAATRARERLVVSLFHKPLKDDAHEERHPAGKCALAECLHAIQLEEGGWPQLYSGMPFGSGIPGGAATDDTPEMREAWLAARQQRIAAGGEARVRAVTAIAHADDEKAEPEAEGQPWKKGRAGTSVGRAVHAVMQTVDLRTGEGLQAIAESQALAEGIAGEAHRIARLAESARTSQAVQAAVASGKYWRELYVGVEIAGTLVEGFIDLLYETPEGLVVVDYKTDSVRDEADIDTAMERYRLQGAGYALALERALGRRVVRATFVFTEPRAERDVADLGTVKAEIEAKLAAWEPATPAGG